MKTHRDYVNGKWSHREYYGQFVTNGTKRLVINGIGIEAIQASTDPYFNDIPLDLWDRLVPGCPGSSKFKGAGDYYTLAGGVCLLKEAARQIKERIE